MTRTVVADGFDRILKSVAERLKPLGFRRRGASFRVFEQGNCGLVEFQRSSSNTRDRLLFTINVGVVCGELLADRDPALPNVHIVDSHLRERIGFLLPDRQDKWWEITDATDTASLADDVSRAVVDDAVPYVRRHLSTNSLLALWQSGSSPGLTDAQRVRLVAALAAKREGGGL